MAKPASTQLRKSSLFRHFAASGIVGSVVALPIPLAAAESGQVQDFDRITVSATRGVRDITDVPRSITILTREEIEQQLRISNDLGEILGNLVPGMGASVEGRTNATGQDMIRGRRLQVVLDGVVMNNGHLDFREEFTGIDPNQIERVEVIRGGSAVYGFGAGGGIIVITTRKPAPGQSSQISRLGASFQPTEIGDSFGWSAHHAGNWATDTTGFRVSLGYMRHGERFDGDGDPRPSNFSQDETRDYNIATGFSWYISDLQRFDISASFANSEEYDKSIATGADPLNGIKARPVRVGPGINDLNVLARVGSARPSGREQSLVTANYDHADLFGGSFNALAYFLQRENWTDTLLFNTGVPLEERPAGYNHPKLRRSGLRLTLDTPFTVLSPDANVQWGLDLERSTFTQPNTAGLTRNSPDITSTGSALFAQLESPIAGTLRFVGGLRYEQQEVEIPTFTVSETYFNTNAGNVVQGGTRDFDELVTNASLLYDFSAAHTGYIAFAQGFTSGEILRAIRDTAASSVREAVELEPQVIDNYEIGLRGFYDWWSINLAAFYSRSSLGVTFVWDPDTLLSNVERAPERIWGLEITADARPRGSDWQFGGAASWQEGERRDEGGQWDSLPGNRINPLKVSAYVGHRPRDWADWHLQALYTGSRDKFPGSTRANEGRVDSVVLFDLAGNFRVPIGELSIGVRNLLDKQYIPPYLQANNFANNYYAATGRTVTLTLQREW